MKKFKRKTTCSPTNTAKGIIKRAEAIGLALKDDEEVVIIAISQKGTHFDTSEAGTYLMVKE